MKYIKKFNEELDPKTYRIVGGNSENIEKAVDAFTKMKIQGLYDDDLPTVVV